MTLKEQLYRNKLLLEFIKIFTVYIAMLFLGGGGWLLFSPTHLLASAGQ